MRPHLALMIPMLLLAACGQRTAPATGRAPAHAEDAVINVFNWFDYIRPELLRDFTARTGVQVHYDVFASPSALESRMLAGHTGYDVVFPSGALLERLIAAGVFQRLDRAGLPHWDNLDPQLMARLAEYDAGNAHAVVYAWGITALAYDARKLRARLPGGVPDSWSLLLDPRIAGRIADCGIGLYESPNILVSSTFTWLGLAPDTEDPGSLERAGAALGAIRPFVRNISNGSLVDDLSTGQLCLIIASDGDARQAHERAHIASSGIDVRFLIPKEGAALWIDAAAIPVDAPHPRNARRFIDYLLEADVAAANANAIHFATGNRAAQPQLDAELRTGAILPGPELAARLFREHAHSERFVRERTRIWTRFRTGR